MTMPIEPGSGRWGEHLLRAVRPDDTDRRPGEPRPDVFLDTDLDVGCTGDFQVTRSSVPLDATEREESGHGTG